MIPSEAIDALTQLGFDSIDIVDAHGIWRVDAAMTVDPAETPIYVGHAGPVLRDVVGRIADEGAQVAAERRGRRAWRDRDAQAAPDRLSASAMLGGAKEKETGELAKELVQQHAGVVFGGGQGAPTPPAPAETKTDEPAETEGA